MQEFFAGENYTGARFHLFGTSHLIAISIIVLCGVALWVWRGSFTPRRRQFFCYGLAAIMLINEFMYHIWRWATGQWNIQTMLPLHLCAVLVYSGALLLITKNYTLYQLIYFMGLGAASQAILTPDAGIYGFPHFRFFEIFISHGSVVLVPLYMTFVERYRPTWKSLVLVMVSLNIYAAFVQIVNFAVGGNYLWIARKPDFPTLIDVLGPWPWYILSLEGIALFVYTLLYLPFAFGDWAKRRTMPSFSGTEQ